MHLSEPYIVVIVIGFGLSLFLWWGSRRSARRESEIVASRSSDTQDSFVTSFRPEVQSIARALYSELHQYTATGKLPFQKSDRVTELLRIGKVDLDEALKHVANKFACREPTSEDDSKFRGRETFEDFVEFIHHLRTTEPHLEHSGMV